MFRDRSEAGRLLAAGVGSLTGLSDPPFGGDLVVLGLPRGGVPVAYQVARALRAPLDVIIVRKLGVPFQPEWAMGAIGEGGARVISDDIVRAAGVGDQELAAIERRERSELTHRARALRQGRPPVPLAGRAVILVDDGIATGATMRVACAVALARGARMVVVAVPVGPADVDDLLCPPADRVCCLERPTDFFAVGQAYRRFAQTTDAEVAATLGRVSWAPGDPASPTG